MRRRHLNLIALTFGFWSGFIPLVVLNLAWAWFQ